MGFIRRRPNARKDARELGPKRRITREATAIEADAGECA